MSIKEKGAVKADNPVVAYMKRNGGIIIGFFILATIIQINTPQFLTSKNIISVLRQISTNLYCASAITMILIAGGIDLSIGAVTSLSSVVVSTFMVNYGFPIPLAIFIDTFANLCLSILAIWILSRIDIKLTIVMCVPIFATVSLGILSKYRLSVLSKMNRNIAQKISSDAYAFVQSFEMIKMSGMEEYVIDQIESQNEIKKKIDLKRNRLLSMIGILNQITGDLTIAFLLLFMAKPLKESTISLGDFTIFIFYSRYVTEFTAVYLSSYVMKKRQTEVSINNLNEILGVCEKEDRVEDRVLRNIVGNLKDEKIDFVELVGQNGSGKTYLAESVFNFMIKNHRIAVLSQTPIIFNTSIKKNIILDRSLDTSRFNCVTSLAALEEDEFSEGFESIAGIRGAMFSGRQIFRIALARLLYNEPYYIIIDGGLNAVEEDERETILHNLYNRYRGRILYTTTQDVQYGFIENKKIITL